MAGKEPEKSESSQSARIRVFEFQVDGGSATRIPSAKSIQDSTRAYSSSKIGGLAGLQPVLGRWNVDEREHMNEYLLNRLRGKTGNDVEADEKSLKIPPDSLQDYLEEMLKTPSKLDEFVLKGSGFEYNSKDVEAELRILAEEARKAADDEGMKRLAASREMLKKTGTGSGTRIFLPDTERSPRTSLRGSNQDISVIGIQLMKHTDLAQDPSARNRFLQTQEPSGSLIQKHSGRSLKVPGKDGRTWSPTSSEIQVHDDDLRGSSGTTTPSNWSPTTDIYSGRDTGKPAQESKKGTIAPVHFLGQGSRGHDAANGFDPSNAIDASRPSSEIVEGTGKQTTGQNVTPKGHNVTPKDHSVPTDTAAGIESDAGEGKGTNSTSAFETAFPPTSSSTHTTTRKSSDGAKKLAKKKQRSKKGRRTLSNAMQDSLSSGGNKVKPQQIQTLAHTKHADDLPPPQLVVEHADKLPPPQPVVEHADKLPPPQPVAEPSSVSRPPAEAKKDSARKKVAPSRKMKIKSPRPMSAQRGRDLSTDEPDSESSPEAVKPEMVPIKHPITEHAQPERDDHEAESPTEPVKAETKPQMLPVAQEQTPAQPPDQQHPSLQPTPARQTLQDDIFFGFYFTRAFVFSYFRTKPSHYDPHLSMPLLKSDVLDAAQRRLLKNLIEDPSRYRCVKELRAVDRMQALAKMAAKNAMATSPIIRQLHQLPNLLGNA